MPPASVTERSRRFAVASRWSDCATLSSLPNRHIPASRIGYALLVSPRILSGARLQEEHVCNLQMLEAKRKLQKGIVQERGRTPVESRSQTKSLVRFPKP